jgi:hypothetical protein
MCTAQVSQDEYAAISSLLERLNAERTGSVDGPAMCRESSRALFEPALLLKVIQDDAGKVTVLVSDVQLLSGTQFLEMALAAMNLRVRVAATAAG